MNFFLILLKACLNHEKKMWFHHLSTQRRHGVYKIMFFWFRNIMFVWFVAQNMIIHDLSLWFHDLIEQHKLVSSKALKHDYDFCTI